MGTGFRNIRLFSSLVFILIAGLVGLDLITDTEQGVSPGHVMLEGLVLVAALVGAGLTFRTLLKTRSDLSLAQGEARNWRAQHREVLDGLSAAIGAQFDAWSLSPAEREIGYLLLKGLSMEEIARVRGTSERTARDQARAVYRKAGLGGRSELSAFFLEDLLAPTSTHG